MDKFLGLLFLYIVLQIISFIRPYRKITNYRKHIFGNLLLAMVSTGMLIALPFGLFELEQIFIGFGLLNLVQLSPLIQTILTILIMDFAIYWQHRLSHQWEFLWHFHEVHHCDPHLDVSSGLRFHPGEILFSFFYKSVILILLGFKAMDLIIFETLITGFALFNHSNFVFSLRLNSALSKLIVTQNFHQVHHSNENREMNSNFCTFLSFWDYLFKTYTNKNMSFPPHPMGVKSISQEQALSIWELFSKPIKKVFNFQS